MVDDLVDVPLATSPVTLHEVRTHEGPISGTERALAEILADVALVGEVSIDSHFFDDLGADSMTMAQFCARVRKRTDLPQVSIKDVYQHPTIKSLAAALDAAALTPVERLLHESLSSVLGVGRIPVDSNFFEDLGADSMVMAQFCARVRKQPDLPAVSIKDVYKHPTIKGLAATLASPTLERPASSAPPAPELVTKARKPRYVLCGALQGLVFFTYTYVAAVLLVSGSNWISASSGLIDLYLRAAMFGGLGFVVACVFPILAKWLLIGRWKPARIPIWSLAYFRFWLVKTLVNLSPLRLFVGSPLYVLYLRALGADIGRGAAIFSSHMPLCTDLLTIGAGSVIRKDVYFNCYRAKAGVIETGPVTLGRDVLVSEVTVLDINTSLGDESQLGHASSLHAGQSVPDHGRWHGSPAQPTEVDYRAVGSEAASRVRPVIYSIFQMVTWVFLYLPVGVGGMQIALRIPQVERLTTSFQLELRSGTFYLDALVVSGVLFFGGTLLSLVITITVPRLLHLMIEPGKTYPLYGLHYSLHRTILKFSNSKFLTALFGDSSFIVPYLRLLGYRLSPVVQTGSNFGTEVKHESPFLVSVGTGTVCASELSIMNADYSSTSFRVSQASIGAYNFLGNLIAYPARGRTGDNCLLATKVLVPIDGNVREGVGLLGSPSFEIPRMVERDSKFARLATPDEIARQLPAKNRHNAATIALVLLGRWVYVLGITLLSFLAIGFYGGRGIWVVGLATFLVLLFTVFYGALVERASTGFRPLKPKYCSIYDIEFWREERFFKLEAQMPPLFDGTPFKSVIWRLLGVRVGRRLFDDGANMAEKNLVALGDDVTLNAGVWLQCHSQEDYAFKSDAITIGSGCTLGVGAMTLYGITMGDGSVLAPDSFLMKGEEVPPAEHWGGNPALGLPESGSSLSLGPALHEPFTSLSPVPAPQEGRAVRERAFANGGSR